MRWLVILLLSLLGVATGYLTLLHTGIRGEQILWLAVFLVSAFFIFRFTEGRHFLHGLVLGFVDCALAVIIHLHYYDTYLSNHPDVVLLNSKLGPGVNPYMAFAFIEMTKSILYALMSGIFALAMGAGIKKMYQ